MTTSDVVAFVNDTSIDCGVTVIVHLGLSVLMFMLSPPIGISSVPVDEPLASGPLLTCSGQVLFIATVVVNVTLPPILEVQLEKVRS